jgi:hypothetical protein
MRTEGSRVGGADISVRTMSTKLSVCMAYTYIGTYIHSYIHTFKAKENLWIKRRVRQAPYNKHTHTHIYIHIYNIGGRHQLDDNVDEVDSVHGSDIYIYI